MSTFTKDHIIESLKKKILDFQSEAVVEKVGTILDVGDGIARIAGLSDVKASEMLDFGNDTYGVALNLEEDRIGAMILGEYSHLKEGDIVESTGRILEIPVGDAMVRRVIDPLGRSEERRV